MPLFVAGHRFGGVLLLPRWIPLTAIPADVLAIFAGGLVASAVQDNARIMRLINGAVALVLLGMAMLELLT